MDCLKTTLISLFAVALVMGAPSAVAEPYTETYQTQGYLSCGFNLVAAGFMACNIVPGDGSQFVQYLTLSGTPTSIESVLTWDATTPAGETLRLLLSRAGGTTLENVAEAEGQSPLPLAYDAGTSGLGAGDELMVRIFPGDTIGLPCVDRPIIGGCTTGVGAAFMQPFTLLTTVHYA